MVMIEVMRKDGGSHWLQRQFWIPQFLENSVLGDFSLFPRTGIWHPPKNLSCRNLSSWVPGLVLPVLFLFCKKKFYLNDLLMLDHNLGSR